MTDIDNYYWEPEPIDDEGIKLSIQMDMEREEKEERETKYRRGRNRKGKYTRRKYRRRKVCRQPSNV